MNLDQLPPCEGLLKMNFYGSSKGNLVPGSFGCVIRNNNNNVVQVLCCPLRICDSLKPKL